MKPSTLHDALLAWYAAHRRPLPWRLDPTPYKVLLAEIMCQQTRIDTVLPRYAAFLARWPDFEALAAADEAEVLGAWSGLGYYRRARALHAAARQVAREGFPTTLPGLRRLPGVGPYTAGAVASVALGMDVPAVDGNVLRVLSRLDDRPGGRDLRRATWRRAEELLPPGKAGDWNQALMELGALVCRPARPRCDRCPVAARCEALRAGTVAERPVHPRRPPPPRAQAAWGIWRASGRVLLERRPSRGLLGSTWAPPGTPLGVPGGADDRDALLGALEARLDAPCSAVRRLGVLEHVFTHRRQRVTVWEVTGPSPPEPAADLGWFGPDDLRRIGLSTLARRALALA